MRLDRQVNERIPFIFARSRVVSYLLFKCAI